MKAAHICSALLAALLLASCSKPGDLKVQQAMDAYKKQQYEEALGLFMQAAEEETNYSKETLYTFISTIYTMQEEYEEAVAFQKKSLALKKDYRTIISLAMNCHLLGKDEEAEAACKEAISFAPGKAEAYAMLGALHLGQDNAAAAVEHLEKARDISPKLSVVRANLAVAYAKTGDFVGAETELAAARNLKCENLGEFERRVEEIRAAE